LHVRFTLLYAKEGSANLLADYWWLNGYINALLISNDITTQVYNVFIDYLVKSYAITSRRTKKEVHPMVEAISQFEELESSGWLNHWRD